MEPFIIITAPHSKCDPSAKERMCDKVAKQAAETLSSLIKYKHKLLLANIYRSECDLNRKKCINTDYWQQEIIPTIDDPLKKYNPIFLIDIHSFPSTPDISLLPLFIIDYSGGKDYVHNLVNTLINNGIKTERREVEPVNAIIQYSLSKDIPSLLIEFNENLSIEDIKKIDEIILIWLEKEINKRSDRKILKTYFYF